MGKKWWLAAVLAVALGGAGVAAWIWHARTARKPAPAPAAKAAPLPPGSEVRLQGRLVAQHVVKVDAPIDGVVQEFAVKPGEDVYEGQILAHIQNDLLEENSREAASELERAKTRLSTAESNLLAARLEDSRATANVSRARDESARAEKLFLRQQLLWREGATPRRSFENAEKEFNEAKTEAETLSGLAEQMSRRVAQANQEVENAKKALAEMEDAAEQAKTDLAAADLRSPADGVIVAITKSAGDEVTKGMQGIVEVATDLALLEAVLTPEPPILARLKPGAAAQIEAAEVPGDGIPARIRAIEGGEVFVEFASPTTLLRPGMTVLVRLKLE
jgi:multidrug resistance efflux pump